MGMRGVRQGSQSRAVRRAVQGGVPFAHRVHRVHGIPQAFSDARWQAKPGENTRQTL